MTSLKRELLRGTGLPGYWRDWDEVSVVVLSWELEDLYRVAAERYGAPAHARPHPYMLLDLYALYYAADAELEGDLAREPETAWDYVLRSIVESEEYPGTKRVTVASHELSVAAAVVALAKLLAWLYSELGEEGADPASQPAPADDRGGRKLRRGVSRACRDVAKTVRELARFMAEAEAAAMALRAGAGGDWYTHFALSIRSYLENPEEARRRLSLLVNTARLLPRMVKAAETALSRMTVEDKPGIPAGVKKMESLDELQHLTAVERGLLGYPSLIRDEARRRAVRAVLAARLAEKSASVIARYSTVTPVIFVDKSGSMAEAMPGAGVEKISVATALALAFVSRLNTTRVYFFDTEVYPAGGSRRRIIEELLRIRAEGGTDISKVFNTIAEIDDGRKRYIIITDGIDEPSPSVERVLERRGLRRRVSMLFVPPGWHEKWSRLVQVRRADTLDDFMRAVRSL